MSKITKEQAKDLRNAFRARSTLQTNLRRATPEAIRWPYCKDTQHEGLMMPSPFDA